MGFKARPSLRRRARLQRIKKAVSVFEEALLQLQVDNPSAFENLPDPFSKLYYLMRLAQAAPLTAEKDDA